MSDLTPLQSRFNDPRKTADEEESRLIDLIWISSVLRSSEHFTARRRAQGYRLSGVVVLPLDGQPAHIEYSVDADAAWHTRRVGVSVTSPILQRKWALAADGVGHWVCDGVSESDLGGCVDIDLGWTPSTNSLPIRRLELEVGEARQVDVAWLRFPELILERSSQTYEKRAEDTWRYSSGRFTADLQVDANGIVHRYGDDLWTTIAVAAGHGDPPP